MHFTQVILLCLLSAYASGNPTPKAVKARDVSDVTIFTPPADDTQPGTLYARTVLLTHGTSNGIILATWENYSPDRSHVSYPIYSSNDAMSSSLRFYSNISSTLPFGRVKHVIERRNQHLA